MFSQPLGSLRCAFYTRWRQKGFDMNILVGIVVVALIAYLFASVLKPEWF